VLVTSHAGGLAGVALHAEWFQRSAVDLLGKDLQGWPRAISCTLVHERRWYTRSGLYHMTAAVARRSTSATDVLLYDLTRHHSRPIRGSEGEKRRSAIARSPAGLCQITALVVTPDSLPLAYEVLPGKTADNDAVAGVSRTYRAAYGKARRIW